MAIDPKTIQWDAPPQTVGKPVTGSVNEPLGGGVIIPAAPKDAAAENRAQAAEARAQAAAEREALRFKKEMTGVGRKPLREGDAQKLTNDVSSVESIERALNSFQDDFAGLTADVENVVQGVTGMGTPGQRDWWADFRATDNQIRNELFGASLTAGEKSAYSATTITPRMSPEEIKRNLSRRLEIARKATARRYNRLNAAGYNPDEVSAIVGEVDIQTPVEQRAAPQEPKQLELTAGENFSTEEDKAHADALTQAVRNGASLEELVAISQGFGATLSPDDIASFNQAINVRSQGGPVTFTPRKSGTRSPIAQAAGEALMTPAGTALTGAVNAAGVGLLSQVAGDQVQGLEALNPVAGMTGEIVGSALGTAGLAKGGALLSGLVPGLAGRVAGGGTAGAIARELATEGTYGGLYAANTGEDVLTGAALGAAGSLGGRAVGAGLSRVAPMLPNAISPIASRVSGFLGRNSDNGGAPPAGGMGPDGMPPAGGGATPPAGGMPPSGVPGGAAPTGGAPIDQAAMQAADETFIPETFRSRDAGSAASTGSNIRASRAQELPVPIELARFQRSRLFEEQQRARELAKNNEVGGPIRARLAEQQEALRQNFDRFIDETGSEVWENAREKGVVVDQALKKLADVGKTRIRVLYKRAEKAGELAEPVEYAPIKAFIDEQDATTRQKLAPVLDAVANQLTKNDPNNTGAIPINALESVRKLINKVAQPGTPDATFGAELKDLIDTATEGKGGDLYQQARAARIQYRKTFEDAGLVKKLMGTKPGTTDRQVALEKVAEQAIYSGGTALDDIKALKGVLDQASARGERAWRELQGATLEHIRDQAYKGITTDQSGQRVLNAKNLDTVITNLDRSGKLDYVLGRQTANLLRTINDVAKDVVTAPPGSVNASNTSSAAMNAMDTLATWGLTSMPIPAGKLLSGFRSTLQNRELRKEVKRLLD